MSYRGWHVGMKVVCVDDTTRAGTRWFDGEALEAGRVYTISKIFMRDEVVPTVHLFEVTRTAMSRVIHGDDVGYRAERFRPVQTRKTDISIFTALLSPTKERERA